MSQGGYLLIVRDHERQGRMGERVEAERYFTDAVTANNWQGQSREIALVSLDGESIGHICLVERKHRVATYRMLLHFSRFHSLDEPLSFEIIRSSIGNRVRRYFEALVTSSEGGWVTSATWNEILRVISELRPQAVPTLNQLDTLRGTFRRIFDATSFDVLAEEKDAYTSIIRFAGFESVAESSVIAWQPTGDQLDAAPSSFVASINSAETVTITEDQAIEHDATRFGDWTQLRQFVTGDRIFRKRDETLLIRNVNKKPLEATLGVDLIYYNYSYRAFIMVQYKRMERETGSEYRYRPDQQFEKEIQRMREFEQEVSSLVQSPTNLKDYRLNGEAFYFKFHEDEIFDPVNASLIPGMHVPLTYWDLFEKSDQARGPLGGIFVGYDNMGRYLNNTEFESVVSKGLIGSSGTITDVLLQIVKPLVMELNHSVTVGVKA